MLSSRAVQFSTKTPARSKQRAENAHAYSTTIHNGKINLARTPFQPKTAQPQRILKEMVVKATNTITRNRPLADKTPFANRVLPPHDSAGSARASSTRKHPRAPNSAIKKIFQTPANNGNHWDVSDGDIVVPQLGPSEAEVVEEDLDDNDSIEYMPPNNINIAYDPPFDFDLPNYSQIGSQVLRTVYSYPAVEGPPPSFEFEMKENEFGKWEEFTSILAPLPESPPPTRPTTRLRSTTISMSQVTPISSKPASALTRPTTATLIRAKAVGTGTRPATSAGTRPPIAKPTSTTTRASRTTTTTASRKPLTAIATATAKPVAKPPPTTRPVVSRVTLSKPAKPTTTTSNTTRKPTITKSTIVKPTPTTHVPSSAPKATSSSRTNLKPRTQLQPQPPIASSSANKVGSSRSTSSKVRTASTVPSSAVPPPRGVGVTKKNTNVGTLGDRDSKKTDGSSSLTKLGKKNVRTSDLSSLGIDKKGKDKDENDVSTRMEIRQQNGFDLSLIREVEFNGDGDGDGDGSEVDMNMNRDDISVVIENGSEVESLIEEKELVEDGVLFGIDDEEEVNVVEKVEKVEVEVVESIEEVQEVEMVEIVVKEVKEVIKEDEEEGEEEMSIEQTLMNEEIEQQFEVPQTQVWNEEFKQEKEEELEQEQATVLGLCGAEVQQSEVEAEAEIQQIGLGLVGARPFESETESEIQAEINNGVEDISRA